MQDKVIKVFLVEDDMNFGMVLKAYLEVHNMKVTLIDDGKLAVDAFREGSFDICILDVMLPNVDGFTIAEEVKNINRNIPLIFLTAKTLRDDVLRGFKLGADDYITKPFDSEVLLYKIKAILQRKEQGAEKQTNTNEFQIGSYLFNYRMRTIFRNNKEQKLSPKEAELLKMLCLKMNDVLSRKEALKKIWGNDSYFTTRSMDVFITKLRKYLKNDAAVEIINIHGTGFSLMVENE